MSRIANAKKVFMIINEQLERAYNAPVEQKQSILLNLKAINEELSESIIEKLKKLEYYERREVPTDEGHY